MTTSYTRGPQHTYQVLGSPGVQQSLICPPTINISFKSLSYFNETKSGIVGIFLPRPGQGTQLWAAALSYQGQELVNVIPWDVWKAPRNRQWNRKYLFLKTRCMHSYTCVYVHIYICIYNVAWKIASKCHIYKRQILKKQAKPSLLWPKLQCQDKHINKLFFRRGTLYAFCSAPEEHSAEYNHQ